MDSVNKNSRLLKTGILSISVLLTAASAVSGTVPMMANEFSDKSSAQVQALITIPSIAMMIFILLSSIFIRIFGKRKTVLLGLALGLIGGVTPLFTSNFLIIQISRFILGAGNGLYSTSTASLIGDIWSGDEQRNLLGIQSAVQTLGQSIATFMAGILLGISWHAAYLVYLLFIPVIIIFAIGYNKSTEKAIYDAQKEVKEESVVQKQTKLPVLALVAILMSFIYFNAIMPEFTASGLAIQQMQLQNQSFLSTALAIAGIAGALVTSLYGKIYKVFKHYTPVFIMLLGVIGYFGIIHAANMVMLTISMIILSSTSLIFPYIYGAVMEDVPAASKDFALSVAKVFNNFGAFLSPYAMAATAGIFGLTGAIATLKIAMCYLIFIGIVFLILAILKTNKVKKVDSQSMTKEQ